MAPDLRGSLWMVAAMAGFTLGFAGRDLATRAAPPQLSNLQPGVCGFAMMVRAQPARIA